MINVIDIKDEIDVTKKVTITKDINITKEIKEKQRLNFIFFMVLSFVAINTALFIVGSVYDFEISSVLSNLMKYRGIRVMTIVSAVTGSFLPLWSGFFVITFLFEKWILLCKNEKYNHNKFEVFVAKNSRYFISAYYLLILLGLSLYFFLMVFQSQSPYKYDFRILDTSAYRFYACIIVFSLTLSIWGVTFILMRKYSKKLNNFSKESIKKSIKYLLFFLFSYLTIYIVKHVFGRPFFFSNILLDNPLGMSISEICDKIGIDWHNYFAETVKNSNKWAQVDYKNWWETNNFISNIYAWFTTPDSSNPNKDSYWNMDFPSGHTTAATIFFALGAFFLSDEVAKQKTSHLIRTLASIAFIATFSMEFFMVVYRFHWITDVAFSGFMAIVWWLTASRIVNKNWLKWYTRFCKKKLNEKVYVFYEKDDVHYYFIASINNTKYVIKKTRHRNKEKIIRSIHKKADKLYK